MFDALLSPQFLMIFICLMAGVVLRVSGHFPGTSPKAFNGFVIWISLPALILTQMPKLLDGLDFHWELMIPISMPWIHFLLSFILFAGLARFTSWNRAQIGTLVLTAGLGNTAFVGFPLLRSLIGEEAIPIGILLDQLGSFLTLSTLGVLFASIYSDQEGSEFSMGSVVKKVSTFPPFVALTFATLLWKFGLLPHQGAGAVLEPLAETLVPLALVAVGFQLRISRVRLMRQWNPLGTGLVFKLVLAPLFFYFLYTFAMGTAGLETRVTILESAMAPMITAGVVAEEFGFDGELASLMIGVGIPLSLFSVPLWNLLLTS